MKTSEYYLRPEELFFLGEIIGAKYIDYKYIAAMPDIQKNYLYVRQKVFASLEERGLIEEDFSGDIVIDDDLESLLQPVFFGMTESHLETRGITGNLHVSEKSMTFVRTVKEMLLLKKITDDMLRSFVIDSEVSIGSTNIEKGYHSEKYTSEEMQDFAIIEKAIKALKGEWLNEE